MNASLPDFSSFCPVIASAGNRSQRSDSSFTAGCPVDTPRAVSGSSGLAQAGFHLRVHLCRGVPWVWVPSLFLPKAPSRAHAPRALVMFVWEHFLVRGGKVCQNREKDEEIWYFQSLNMMNRSLRRMRMTCIRERVRDRLPNPLQGRTSSVSSLSIWPRGSAYQLVLLPNIVSFLKFFPS